MERRTQTTDLPAQLTSEMSLARMAKRMGSYLVAGDFGLALSLIFPPIDRITPRGNVCVLTARDTKFPTGASMAEFFAYVTQNNGDLGSFSTETVNHDHIYVISASMPVYLIEEAGDNYSYTLISPENISTLTESEYLLIS